jgi:hypothetical protein
VLVVEWLHRILDPVGARTLAAATLIMAVYGLWQLFRWGCPQHQALIGDLAFFPTNAAGGYCAWRVSRGVSRASVLPLRIFATGMLVFIAADVTYDYVNIHASYSGGDPVDTLWMPASRWSC